MDRAPWMRMTADFWTAIAGWRNALTPEECCHMVIHRRLVGPAPFFGKLAGLDQYLFDSLHSRCFSGN